MAEAPGAVQAARHQAAGDTPAAVARFDRERAEQQGWHRATNIGIDGDGPETQGADETVAVAGGEAKRRHRRRAVAQAVRSTKSPVGSEGKVEELLDGGPVAGLLGRDVDHL